MLVEHELTQAGYSVIGPFATCAEAEAWLVTETPDAAVLDVKLREGPCTEVAIELSRRAVPFVVFSGSNPKNVPMEMRHAPLIPKPSNLDRLAPIVADLLARAAARST